jgi:hypothetical protein
VRPLHVLFTSNTAQAFDVSRAVTYRYMTLRNSYVTQLKLSMPLVQMSPLRTPRVGHLAPREGRLLRRHRHQARIGLSDDLLDPRAWNGM